MNFSQPPYDHINDNKNMWRIGREERRPIKIFANPNAGSFGDFATSLLFINTVAEQFDHRHLTVMFRDDRDYKSELVKLLPADFVTAVPRERQLPSLDLLNTSPNWEELEDKAIKRWYDAGLNQQDLFLTDHMCTANTTRTFDRMGWLRFPEEDVPACTQALVERGLDPNRWFATVHCREAGYEGKPKKANLRDDDHATYWPATVHIIKKLGGQVVRLGHPKCTPWPQIRGLVDLTQAANSVYLQIFAVAKSRFLLGSGSGPSGVANALHVPHMQMNALVYNPMSDRLIYRTPDLVAPDGTRYAQEALFDAGLCKLVLLDLVAKGEPWGIMKNDAQEVTRAANFVYAFSADCTGWRQTEPPDPRPRPNQLVWPSPPPPRGHFLPPA